MYNSTWSGDRRFTGGVCDYVESHEKHISHAKTLQLLYPVAMLLLKENRGGIKQKAETFLRFHKSELEQVTPEQYESLVNSTFGGYQYEVAEIIVKYLHLQSCIAQKNS